MSSTKQKKPQASRNARKSAAVPLVLAASAMLTACGNKSHRDEYASYNDCIKDWVKPELCEPQRSSSSGSSYRYYGPSYDDGHRDSLQRNVRTQSGLAPSSSNHAVSRSVSRGGFGGSSRSGFSSGG